MIGHLIHEKTVEILNNYNIILIGPGPYPHAKFHRYPSSQLVKTLYRAQKLYV